MPRRATILPAALLAIACSSTLFLGAHLAMQPPAGQPPAAGGGGGGGRDLGRQLIEGLKATPGCLGTEAAQTQSGKNVIFAWFENKKAVMAWYKSDAHQAAMEKFNLPPDAAHHPLEGIPDDSGPIMVAASLKFSGQPLPGTNAPVSEIAIELYSPLRGGIRLNGGFAPASLKVPGRQDITIEPAKPEAPPAPPK